MTDSKDNDPTTVPWPFWMRRFIATDDESAFWDLVWSVGGSPPYGGVSYDEAQAVYDLLEDYRGPGRASPQSYAQLEKFAKKDPERLNTLEAFRINDEITSDPTSYGPASVNRGLSLAENVGDDGLRCLFLAYESEQAYRADDVSRARDIALEALKLGLSLADNDTAYAKRVAQLAQNAVSLTALSGDSATAERLQEQLEDVMDPDLVQRDDRP